MSDEKLDASLEPKNAAGLDVFEEAQAAAVPPEEPLQIARPALLYFAASLLGWLSIAYTASHWRLLTAENTSLLRCSWIVLWSALYFGGMLSLLSKRNSGCLFVLVVIGGKTALSLLFFVVQFSTLSGSYLTQFVKTWILILFELLIVFSILVHLSQIKPERG